MKKSILKITLTGAIVMASMAAFSQQNNKVTQAKRDISEDNKHLTEAKNDSASDFQAFKKDAEMRIGRNKQKISALMKEKSNESESAKKIHHKKVLALEKRNEALEKRIKGCNKIKTTMWSVFKRDFNNDMDALGNSIRDI